MTAFVLIRLVLTLQAPGGVAGPEQQSERSIDLPLATAPGLDGPEPHVPVTSLAGSLRASLAADPELANHVEELMGPPPNRDDEDELAASALRMLGTQLDSAGTVSRVRVAINRERRAAAAGSGLRHSQHLAPGTRITAYMQLDQPELWGVLRSGLQRWQPYVGGDRTVGHGASAVKEIHHRFVDLNTAEGRRAWLTTRGPDLFDPETMTPVPVPESRASNAYFSARWTIVDGLHIGVGGPPGREPQAADPVLALEDNTPYVPGSTWKGVLRSRCEFILRSLGVPACTPRASDDVGVEACPPPCGECLVCHAFGSPGTDEHPGRQGSLAFDNSDISGAVVDAAQPHVALDRVVGGAHRGLLFFEQVVRTGQLTLTVRALHETPREVHALLVLACRDIHDGYLGVGGSSHRGQGTLERTQRQDELDKQRDEAIATLTHYCDNITGAA